MRTALSIREQMAWLLSVFFVVSASTVTYAQPPSAPPAATPISSKYVPDDALALLVFSPQELINSSTFEMFPIEIFRAQAVDKAGIDPADVSMVKIMVGMPGPAGPVFGLAAETTADVDVSSLLALLDASPDAVDVQGISAYVLQDPPGTLLHQADARTMIAASGDWLPQVIGANSGTGQLASLAANVPRQPGVTLIAALKPVRPMISGIAQQQAQQLPPALQPLGRLPELVDALLINANIVNMGGGLRITMLCVDDNSAAEVEQIVMDALAFGKELGIAQAKQAATSSQESEVVVKATLQYIDRIAAKFSTMLTPTRSGRRVMMNVQTEASLTSIGVMTGLLLPAVQSAREAARRMNASNNIKQIMLAMHNYHAAKGQLPAPAITDADGKPLLSWRVSLLPYFDQQALYEQFHLDEPWDSAHNMPLSQTLPSVYVDPSATLPPGDTVFHAAVGDGLALMPGEQNKFSMFTDGTSNTIMIYESNRNESVPWSKPADAEIDLNAPMAPMGTTHAGGFHVGMADGSIRFIVNSIDQDMLKALLTRAGGEAVRIP